MLGILTFIGTLVVASGIRTAVQGWLKSRKETAEKLEKLERVEEELEYYKTLLEKTETEKADAEKEAKFYYDICHKHGLVVTADEVANMSEEEFDAFMEKKGVTVVFE